MYTKVVLETSGLELIFSRRLSDVRSLDNFLKRWIKKRGEIPRSLARISVLTLFPSSY